MHSALFENNVFLVAQHMMQFAVTGCAAAPMPGRISAWGVYDVFTVQGGEQIFLAAVSNTQWAVFCSEFGFDDLSADARLNTNNQRVQSRDWLLPMLRERLAPFSAQELGRRFEAVGLPFAPITRPQDLFDDPHLLAIDGERLQVRRGPPGLGEHGAALLDKLGYDARQIRQLVADGVLGGASGHDGRGPFDGPEGSQPADGVQGGHA